MSLGRRKRRWENNFQINLKEMGWKRVDWINLAQDRGKWQPFVSTVTTLRVP